MEKQFYKKSGDIFRAKVSHPYELLGHYLEDDIQGVSEECYRIIDICDQIKDGQLDNWGGCGNSFEIDIDKNNVLIKFQWSDEKISLELEEYVKLLQDWGQFIDSHQCR